MPNDEVDPALIEDLRRAAATQYPEAGQPEPDAEVIEDLRESFLALDNAGRIDRVSFAQSVMASLVRGSVGEARTTLRQLAATGQLSPGQIRELGAAAAALAAAAEQVAVEREKPLDQW